MINLTGILPSYSHVSIIVWLHDLEFNETLGEKARWRLHKDVTLFFEQFLEAVHPQNSSCMNTCLPSHELFKLDEQDMLGTAGEAEKIHNQSSFVGSHI